MIKLDFRTLAEEVKGELVDAGLGSVVFEGVSIDSRTLRKAELFIAIRGESDDGHKYINDALKKKTAGLMISSDYAQLPSLRGRVPIVIVRDTHESMMKLARAYRKKLKARFIVITGSNGKTTTKEFVYAMIRSLCDKTYRSPGNLNNLYGLPLAIFSMPIDCLYSILELGISIPGEMSRLTEIVQPDVALITNVGPTHLETLGSVEGVARAKLELVDSMGADKALIINSDDPILISAATLKGRKFITYGIKNPADFTAQSMGISDDGFPLVKIDNSLVKVRLFGDHQIYNILAGYAICKTCGLNIRPDRLNDIDYSFAPNRGEILDVNGLTVISDCYNANPVSLESGLRSFHNYLKSPAVQNRRSIVVIGDMLELGEKSKDFHRYIGALLPGLGFLYVFTVGPLSIETYQAAVEAGHDKSRIKHFRSTDQAGEALLRDIKRGDIVYFKASRGIGLERIISLLKGAAFRQN